MNFEPGTMLHNFTVLNAEHVSEIDGTAYTMRHEPSGARLLYIANSDVEKTFAIGFKTPPVDDTGVFHIIEHSVLCGSDKFPVKDPFVYLLKTSMQTFLNAMTFVDKTIYPVSSTNVTDLLNLADIYMDAVLHPLLCNKSAIFEQEGWHIEAAPSDGDATALAYNGIVYNEMKGALADPESRLLNALDTAMFPDTAYGHESGGAPEHIPELSYEQLLDTYKRHYSLKNSYLYLYGDLDADRFLAFLDEKYLTPEAKRTAGCAPKEPIPLVFQAPVRSCGNTLELTCDPKRCGMAIGYGAGTFSDRTRLMAIDILLEATMGNNEAPLRRTLLDAGLADAVNGCLRSGVLQPYVIVTLRGMKEGAPERFRKELEAAALKLANGALDRKLVEAALLKDEFAMCEFNYGSTSGLNLYRRAMESWLYDEEQVTKNLRFENEYIELKKLLNQGYFEQLLKELFCDNPHTADVVSVAINEQDAKKSAVDIQLSELERTMSSDDFASMSKRVDDLRAFQEQPDSPQAVAALPRLTLSDLGCAPSEPPSHLENAGEMRVLRHEVNTHSIVYTDRRFDAKCVDYDELPYLSLLALLYGKLDTQQHTASELSTLIDSRLGKLEFTVSAHEKAGDHSSYELSLGVRTSSRADRVADAAQISREVMTQTVFNDRDKLKRVLTQRLERMERGISAGSTWTVMNRAQSYFLPSTTIKEATLGIDFYRFLKDLMAHFDERYDTLVAKLCELAGRFYSDENCTMSFVGSDDELSRFLEAGGSFSQNATPSNKRLVIPALEPRNEAFITPADVTYSALFFDHRLLNTKYTGSWNVARKALSFDYLWNEVRVKGGAYGGSFEVGRLATVGFCAWRDPHLQRTVDCFKKASDWLYHHEPSRAELEGYIISAVADMDAPKKPYAWARAQMKDYIEGYTPEMKRACREQAIATTPDDLKALAAVLHEVVEKGAMSALGNRAAIERSTCGFTPIDVLA